MLNIFLLLNLCVLCAASLVEHDSCSKTCPAGTTCKTPASMFAGSLEVCYSDEQRCLEPDRECTTKEKLRNCNGFKNCQFYEYFRCFDDFEGTIVYSDTKSAIYCYNEPDCQNHFEYIPSGTWCKTEYKKIAPGVYVQHAELKDKTTCKPDHHCPTQMGCWLDSEWYGDGLWKEEAERCYFRSDPCPNVNCSQDEFCEIQTKYVEDTDKRSEICKKYGSSCQYLFPSTENVVCTPKANATNSGRTGYLGHWSYGRR